MNEDLETMAAIGEKYRSIVRPTLDLNELAKQLARVDPVANAQMHMMGDVDVTQLGVFVHFCTRWRDVGRPVFNLTDGLAAGLMLTRPPEVYDELEHMPFPSWVVGLPAGAFPYADTHVALLTVHAYDGITNKLVEIALVCPNGRVRLYSRVPRYAEDYDGADLDAIRFTEEDAFSVPLDDADQRALRTAQRLVRNLLRFMAGRELGVPDNAQRGRRGVPLPPAPDRPRIWVVGRDVKLPRVLRDAAREGCLGGPGWKLRTRHVVCGHYRMQPYGEKSALRKRIWIEPFWQGPEGEEAFMHLHRTHT